MQMLDIYLNTEVGRKNQGMNLRTLKLLGFKARPIKGRRIGHQRVGLWWHFSSGENLTDDIGELALHNKPPPKTRTFNQSVSLQIGIWDWESLLIWAGPVWSWLRLTGESEVGFWVGRGAGRPAGRLAGCGLWGLGSCPRGLSTSSRLARAHSSGSRVPRAARGRARYVRTNVPFSTAG